MNQFSGQWIEVQEGRIRYEFRGRTVAVIWSTKEHIFTGVYLRNRQWTRLPNYHSIHRLINKVESHYAK